MKKGAALAVLRTVWETIIRPPKIKCMDPTFGGDRIVEKEGRPKNWVIIGIFVLAV
jgi:hypothetical protein